MSVVIDGSNGVDIGAGNLTFPNNTIQTTTGQPTLMTAVTISGSPTSIDFTGIPDWAKKITVLISNVITSGAYPLVIQIGDSGGIEVTGYTSLSVVAGGSVASVGVSSTIGFALAGNAALISNNGSFTITNISANAWVGSGAHSVSSGYTGSDCGSKTLSGTLDRLRVVGSGTGAPTDTFSSGIINVMYE